MENLNKYIDHTYLRPDATQYDIHRLCQEAEENQFASICVAPYWIPFSIQNLTSIPVATVIGFPHGNNSYYSKIQESAWAIDNGATELDVVANIGAIKTGNWIDVENEIRGIKSSILEHKSGSIKIKYIVEVGYLTDSELFHIADLLINHKIDFIKTCTGYGPRGVTEEDIKKIKNYVGDRILIKASGGIRDRIFCERLIKAGADRIGASSSIEIIKNKKIISNP